VPLQYYFSEVRKHRFEYLDGDFLKTVINGIQAAKAEIEKRIGALTRAEFGGIAAEPFLSGPGQCG